MHELAYNPTRDLALSPSFTEREARVDLADPLFVLLNQPGVHQASVLSQASNVVYQQKLLVSL